jgi:hypothetical protein
LFPKVGSKNCGPFEILENIGSIAHIIALSTYMRVHNVLNVSLLKKCVPDPNHIIDWTMIQVENEGDFWVELMHILEWKFKVLWKKSIGLVKVQWTYYGHENATWEYEKTMREEYSQFFVNFEQNRN